MHSLQPLPAELFLDDRGEISVSWSQRWVGHLDGFCWNRIQHFIGVNSVLVGIMCGLSDEEDMQFFPVSSIAFLVKFYSAIVSFCRSCFGSSRRCLAVSESTLFTKWLPLSLSGAGNDLIYQCFGYCCCILVNTGKYLHPSCVYIFDYYAIFLPVTLIFLDEICTVI